MNPRKENLEAIPDFLFLLFRLEPYFFQAARPQPPSPFSRSSHRLYSKLRLLSPLPFFGSYRARFRIGMEEKKPLIGLSWNPKLPVLSSSTKVSNVDSEGQSETSSLWKPNAELVDGLYLRPNDPRKLNKLLKNQAKDTLGKDWFDMAAPTITPELKKDLQLLKLRNALDPKRHYKKSDSKSKSLPKYFQVGTVVESATDFFSGRLTKKERKASLADEVLSDRALAAYRKRKVQEIEEQNRPAGNDKWKIKGRQSRKRAKQRRH